MDTSTALVIVALIAGATASFVALLMRRTGKDATGAVTAVVATGIESTRQIAQPISDGVGNVLQSISVRIDKTKELEREIISLSNEIERLRSARFEPASLKKPFIEFGFEVPHRGYHFLRQTIRSSPRSVTAQKESVEYVGVFEVSFVRKIGVQVRALQFELRPNNIIAIGGIQPETLGLKNPKVEKRLAEIRRFRSEGTMRFDESAILRPGDPDFILLEEQREKHEKMIQEQIGSEQTADIGTQLDELVLQFFQLFFRGKYQVLKDDTLSDSKTLMELCDVINRGFNNDLEAKENQLQLYKTQFDGQLKAIKQASMNSPK
jgi:hypothetical protein